MRYGVDNNQKILKESRRNLNRLYEQMPSTKGCMENINKPVESGGCGGWCCREQFPSVWYSEFLNTWNYVSHNLNNEQIFSLIERCLRNYLFPNKERGCVFWDRETKLCQQHSTRPYNCRIYSIEPEEEFNDRLVRLRVIYPNAKEQCNLVSTENGEVVTKKHTKKWWARLLGIESSIGVPLKLMNDEMEGAYRSYHDHILLHFFDDDLMSHLTEIRVQGDPMQKESCIRNVLSTMKDFAEGKYKNKMETCDDPSCTHTNH